MSSRYLSVLVISILLAALAAGPARAEKTLFQQSREATFAKVGPLPAIEKPIRLGVVLSTLSNPFWVTMRDGYQAAAQELGLKADIQAAPQENSVTAQLNILETMVGKDYDAICAHPITASNLIPGLVKAAEKGIPLLTGRRVDAKAAAEAGAKPIYIGLVDFYEQGRLAGECLVRELAKTGGGKVAIIEGLPGSPQSQARRQGAKDVFEKAQGIELISIQPANWDRNKAYTVATNLIQANPDLKGLMCANDIMALAALEAFKAAGKAGQVMVTGIDLISQAKESIATGELAGSVAFSPWVIGELMTRAAVAVVKGRPIPKDLAVTSVLATKENIHLLSDWK